MWQTVNTTHRAGSLIEGVEGALKQTNTIRSCWVNEARRLWAVNHLGQLYAAEGILHIQLRDRPRTRDVAMMRTVWVVAEA